MDYVKQTTVIGIIILAIAAMFVGYGLEIFWIAIAALSGLGGYELKKQQEVRKRKKNDVNTAGRDKE